MTEIVIDNHSVQVVNSFKLLGIHIDNYLSFENQVAEIKRSVNKKLYSLKRLKFLSLSTEIYFFKCFILPNFDYCSSIYLFFNKKLIEILNKFFNLCLYRLLNINVFDMDILNQKEFLLRFNILPLKMRFFVKIAKFYLK